MIDTLNQNRTEKAIILGSGVSVFEDQAPIHSIPYSKIPGFPVGKVKGHKGQLDIYKDLWVLRGRAHIYEGFTWEEACFPTNFLADFGIKDLIITNSAGGINSDYNIGDIMQIKGFLNFIEPGKERGNLDSLTIKVWTFETKTVSEDIKQGVYVGVHGPNYETNAEVKLFNELGADAVGMSTIPELMTAIDRKMNISAFSIITNVYGKTKDLGHEGVLHVAKQTSAKLVKLLDLQ